MKSAFELYNELMGAAQAAGISTIELFGEAGIAPSQATRWSQKVHEPRLSKLVALKDAAQRIATRKGVALGEMPTLDSLL